MLTIGFAELLYTHFGIVIDINDGVVTNIHLEEREA